MESLDFDYLVEHSGDPSLISGLIFICVFLFGIYILFRRKYIKRMGSSGEGEIEDLIAENDGDGLTYRPLVSFYSQLDQRTVVYKSKWGSNFKSYQKGQKVRIIYLPAAPEQFLIDESPSKLIELIFLLTGLIGFLFSFFIL